MSHSLPKQTLAEVLLFLVEKENFSSVTELRTLTLEQIQQSLTDLAFRLHEEARHENSVEDFKRVEQGLLPSYKNLLTQLSREEKEKLIKGFLN